MGTQKDRNFSVSTEPHPSKPHPCTWVKPGRFGSLLVLCFLALGGHCLQMLCLPGFGTHANTQNLPHFFMFSLPVFRSTLPRNAYFSWRTPNCQIVPVLPSYTPPLQYENRSCAAVFGKLRCGSCTATFAFSAVRKAFLPKAALQQAKNCTATLKQLRCRKVARSCRFPADFRLPRLGTHV